MATNLVAHDNRGFFSHHSEGRKSKVKVSAGPPSRQELQGRFRPLRLQLPVAPGVPWLVANELKMIC